MMSLFSFI